MLRSLSPLQIRESAEHSARPGGQWLPHVPGQVPPVPMAEVEPDFFEGRRTQVLCMPESSRSLPRKASQQSEHWPGAKGQHSNGNSDARMARLHLERADPQRSEVVTRFAHEAYSQGQRYFNWGASSSPTCGDQSSRGGEQGYDVRMRHFTRGHFPRSVVITT